jgi:hypothetical protein
MATILPADLGYRELARIFRAPRCYAPDHVVAVLASVVGTPRLALLVDIDSLERSALARVDRVMQLALTALARVGVGVFLAARYERERARALQLAIPHCRNVVRSAPLALPIVRAIAGHDVPLIALSNDPSLFDQLTERDRGLALGRPELARGNVTALADTSVRASLWWLHEERARALAS